jgi:hypothetical protein
MKTQSILVVSLFLAACKADEPIDSGDSMGTDLSYYADVKPILDANCISCHQSGGVGGFSLTNFEEVDLLKGPVANAIASGSMPPWKPNGECNDYLHDARLSQELIDTVSDWIDGGAPEGRPEDHGESQEGPGEGTLSRVDHRLTMSTAYTPTQSPDDYRCFLVDWPFTEDNYVTGYTVHPDNPALVHHVIAFIADPETVELYQAADDAEDGEGWTCFGGPGAGVDVSNVRWLGSWAPGGQRGDFPAGTGIPMKAGSKLVLQVHINTAVEEPAPALVSVDVSVENEVEQPALIQPWTNPSWVFGGAMGIPANTDGVTHEWGYKLPAQYAFKVHSSSLHMHTRGTAARLWVERKDGSEECLLGIDDWDFDWQRSYDLLDPMVLEEGDTLNISCTWDNPTDEDIYWGEGTGDEMCLGTMFVTTN